MMRVTGLHKAFGTHPVLTGVDLEVPEGSLTAILGPSGSGKTTLLRLLAGFERADQGEIVIGGTVVDDDRTHIPPERRRIGYVPQEGSLFPHLTVAANVAFGLPAKQRRAGKPNTLLAAVGLEGLGKRYPHQLSGGQQQRVALSIADLVAVLRDGKIAQCAAPEDLYTEPADPALAAFVGEANLLAGVHVAGSVQTVLGLLPLHQNGGGFPPSVTVTLLVRPEHIELGPPDGSIRATVVAYGYHGHDAVLHVQPDETSPAAGSAAPDAPQEGAPLLVRVIGGDHIPVGSPVTLQARGPVIAWPAQPS